MVSVNGKDSQVVRECFSSSLVCKREILKSYIVPNGFYQCCCKIDFFCELSSVAIKLSSANSQIASSVVIFYVITSDRGRRSEVGV